MNKHWTHGKGKNIMEIILWACMNEHGNHGTMEYIGGHTSQPWSDHISEDTQNMFYTRSHHCKMF